MIAPSIDAKKTLAKSFDGMSFRNSPFFFPSSNSEAITEIVRLISSETVFRKLT